MKYIKSFENTIEEQIGDYTIFNYPINYLLNSEWSFFLNNTIGQIKDIYLSFNKSKEITIKYNKEELPKSLYLYIDVRNDCQRTFNEDTIKNFLLFSPTLEELEIKIAAKKYNL